MKLCISTRKGLQVPGLRITEGASSSMLLSVWFYVSLQTLSSIWLNGSAGGADDAVEEMICGTTI